MSAKHSMGSTMPVDSLAPKISARIGTMTVDAPFTPVFEMPMQIALKITAAHCHAEKIYGKKLLKDQLLCYITVLLFEASFNDSRISFQGQRIPLVN
jgi:hypothetical protein